ncbi:MAG TPA: SRPBCC family protein [Ktedonosporobacter sp.]|nr:SRPBCC family protein [Ktedonosporobacter sp.]
MVQVTHSVIFHCSPAALFAALTDFQNAPKWQPAVIEERALTDGPLQVGVTTYQKRLFMGKPVESTCEIVEFEQDRKMVCRREGEVQTSYILEPTNDGTQLTFSIDLQGKGLKWTLLQPLIKAGLTKDVITRFQTLKGQLEAREQVAA